MKKRILLFKVFGNNIITRSSIFNFFRELDEIKNSDIIIDFNKITFISRSCADEYLKQRRTSKKNLIEVNMSKNICDMFNLVNKQYKKENVNFFVKVIPDCKTNSFVFN